jgi:predicted kinase
MSGKIIMLKGLPASGKTTFAKQLIATGGGRVKRINKDDLRDMIDDSVWSKEREKTILEIRDYIIENLLEKDFTVIIDDTNFHPKHEKRFQEMATVFGAEFVIQDHFCHMPLEDCIERDLKRDRSVGKRVIVDMWRKYLEQNNKKFVQYNPELLDAIICDVDGTLALHAYRSPYDYWECESDELNENVYNLLSRLQSVDPEMKTIVVTGRENLKNEEQATISDLTQRWLTDGGVIYDEFYIREEGDHRPDHVVKKEIYEKYIKDSYNVLYVVDDRKQVVDMWREQGLFVLDIAGHIW